MHDVSVAPTRTSSFPADAQASVACSQRARNAQPDGGEIMFGGAPMMGFNRSRFALGSEERRPRVY
ncbi:MAG: hypothetical protein RI912_375, partial [Actinomycetota bacterium]